MARGQDEGRVLVVEDDADLRETMARALSADGHAVTEAADGRAALDALAGPPFDLVVLDISLGAGPDGIEVCRRLRAGGDDAHVMALTARDAEADVVLALEAGADDYVT
ncbi:MAG TPA: response regulator, partial [Solirubrobacteraceae bacterium]